MLRRKIPKKPEPPPTGRVERVRLIEWPRYMYDLSWQIGTIEGTVGDEVLVRFGETVIQVSPEMIEPVER